MTNHHTIKPMSRTRRRIYLAFSVLVFAAVIPVLILYSEGYRLGDALSLVETGGVYVRSDLSDTSVYVDDELKEETGLLIRNSFIQDLRPGLYTIRVEKDGYRSWQKRVLIEQNLVTEINHLPIPTTISSTTVRRYLPLAAGASATSTRVADPRYAQLARLFATTTATSTSGAAGAKAAATTTKPSATAVVGSTSVAVVDERTLMPNFRDHRGIYAWLDRGRIVSAWPGSYERTPYYFCQGASCVGTTTLALAVGIGDGGSERKDVVSFEWLPSQADGFVVIANDGAYVVDADTRSEPNVYKILSGTGIQVRLDGAEIVFKVGDEFIVMEL